MLGELKSIKTSYAIISPSRQSIRGFYMNRLAHTNLECKSPFSSFIFSRTSVVIKILDFIIYLFIIDSHFIKYYFINSVHFYLQKGTRVHFLLFPLFLPFGYHQCLPADNFISIVYAIS